MRLCSDRWPALARLLAVALVALALAPETATAQVVSGRTEGIFSVVWGDPRPGSLVGATRFFLTTADGRTMPVEIDAAQQRGAIRGFGKRVVVQGRTSARADGEEGIVADSIELLDPVEEAVSPQAVTTRRVLFILLKYKNDPQMPHAPGFFRAMTNPLTGSATLKIPATINGFYDKTSWGRLQWRADVAGAGGLNPSNWLTLPKTKAQYANCGWSSACSDLQTLGQDAMQLAVAAGVDVSVYDNVNFIVNNDLDCCAWGGGFVYNAKFYGATWDPPWAQETGTFVHEFGHSLGLPHSGWVYFAYDSPWDDMSSGTNAQQIQCGSYVSVNSGNQVRSLFCTEPGSGYITAHKDYLGWIPAAKKFIVDRKLARTVTLTANATALAAGIKLVKICLANQACTGASAHFLTVESRIRTAAFEKGLSGEGVIIHDIKMDRPSIGVGNPCFFNAQSGWALPIDATKGDYRGAPNCDSGGRTYPNYALFNAQFAPGQTYNNTNLGITVEVLRREGDAYVVKVTRSK